MVLLALIVSTCSRSPSTLEEVLETGKLRVVTRSSPTTFYRGPFGHEGAEYDRVEAFRAHLEDKFDRTIEVDYQLADSLPELFAALDSGRAHIGAASLTVTDKRSQDVAFAPSYQTVEQVLVYRLNSGRPRTLDALDGKSLEILSGSSFGETLRELQAEHPELTWSENPTAETGDLLLAVQDKDLDYTVVDSHEYHVHRFYMPDLRVAMTLREGDELAWAMNQRSQQLLGETEDFFEDAETSGLLARIEERYYGHNDRFDYVGTRTFKRHVTSRLPDYLELFRKASGNTDIDWRLLAAIGYQESHWNPQAVSPTGVRGLMMLTGATAGSLGVQDRHDAAQSIAAGSQYFLNIYNRLDDVPHPDRVWFALAAYNVGYGHLQDARRLADREGLDSDRWLVIKDMLPKLAKREYYSTLPYGYARGWEPVGYVNNVRTYYEILNWLTLDESQPEERNFPYEPDIQTAANEPELSPT